ncbi:MAG: TAXI family TRAP transporter solute-binding subunit [Deinococcales bacterium]
MRRSWIVLAILAAALLGPAFAQRVQIVIGTGGTGGVYFYYGTQVAQMLTKYAGISATAIQTAASIDNNLLLRDKTDPNRGVYYCELSLPDSALVAYNGTHEKFKGNPAPSRILWVTYPNYLQIVTTADSGIHSLADLAGKRVSTGAPSSGTEYTTLLVLDAAGVKTDSFTKWSRLGAAESADALANGTLDAYFWSGGIPTGSISELATTLKRKGKQLALVSLDPNGAAVQTFMQRFPGLGVMGTIPASTYGTPQDASTLAFWNRFACPASLPDDVAYTITKTVFTHIQDLHDAIKPSLDTTVANTAKFIGHTTIPFHAGAIRYFKEVGAIQ